MPIEIRPDIGTALATSSIIAALKVGQPLIVRPLMTLILIQCGAL